MWIIYKCNYFKVGREVHKDQMKMCSPEGKSPGKGNSEDLQKLLVRLIYYYFH